MWSARSLSSCSFSQSAPLFMSFQRNAEDGLTRIERNDPLDGTARYDPSSTPNRATFSRRRSSRRARFRLSGPAWPQHADSSFGGDYGGACGCSMQST